MLNLSRAAARRSKAEGGESAWDGQRPTWHKEKNGQERGWKKLAFAVLFLSLGSSLSACCLPFIWSHLGSKVDAGSVRQIQGEAARRSSSPKSDDAVQPTQKLDAVTRTVLEMLLDKERKLKTGEQAQGQINEWFATHSPIQLATVLQEGQTSLITTVQGESCFDACQAAGRACQRHWFDVLNDCGVLRQAFPEATKCSNLFYGRDLPAFRPEDSTVLVNQKPKTWAASCGGKHEKTRRLCGCGTRAGGALSKRTFHTIYNVQSSRYFEWQVRYMHLWFREAGMPGNVTRLLSSSKPDHLMSEIPSYIAPPFVREGDKYTPYNKPAAIDHWLRHTRPSEDIVMIVDPDCMIVHKFDAMVEEGSPIAQQAFYNFDPDLNDEPMQIAKRYCHNCTFLDPIAIPVIIHRNDLAKIAPLWLKKTIEIRSDMHNWPTNWTDRRRSNVGLSWTAEMFGYVFAASELSIRHDIWHLQNVPGVHHTLTSPIIHFHVEVKLPNGQVWYKHTEDAGYNIPWPLPDGTDEVSRITITKLHSAWMQLKATNHTWPSQMYAAADRRRRS